MANLSQIRREKMIAFLEKIKEQHNDDESLIAVNEIERELVSKKYGIVWEEHEETVDLKMQDNIPVFSEVSEKEIVTDPKKGYDFLLEGDNLHSLHLLEKTHKGKIDVIYIDPPYNRGKNDFVYDDTFVAEEDGYKHSKWLSFMNKRLRIAHGLLSDKGVIIVNIDEHERGPLLCLMHEIFGEDNNIGEIVWNKLNPKGDSHGVSAMHETIYCFCRNRDVFLSQDNVCMRKKANAETMISKAQSLFKKIGKRVIPEDVAIAIKPFNYSDKIKKDFYVEYDLELVQREFQNWLSKQKFSSGEKAYKYIDDTGRVYRGVSMAWPNKKTAPDDYFIPLIHPVTKKPCPVPERGWRNPPGTMKYLLDNGLIIFGDDESKQPERKYYLDENLYENVPSIYENADSADDMLSAIGVKFEYPKPVSEAIYVCSCIQPDSMLFLDFFAGSGTTGHAILEMNKMDGKERHFILCTSNDGDICDKVTYPRLKTVITGKNEKGKTYSDGYVSNLKVYKTEFIPKDSESLTDDLMEHVNEMIQLQYGIRVDGEKYVVIVDEDEMDEFEKNRSRYVDLKALFISQDVLLSSSQEKMIDSIDTYIIPDCYFDKVCRSVIKKL